MNVSKALGSVVMQIETTNYNKGLGLSAGMRDVFGLVAWDVGNARVCAHAEGDSTTCIELIPLSTSPIDSVALNAWRELQNLISPAQHTTDLLSYLDGYGDAERDHRQFRKERREKKAKAKQSEATWEQIRDRLLKEFVSDGDKQLMVKMYFDDETSPDISNAVGLTQGRIDNIFSEWRKHNDLPSRTALKRMKRQKSLDS